MLKVLSLAAFASLAMVAQSIAGTITATLTETADGVLLEYSGTIDDEGFSFSEGLTESNRVFAFSANGNFGAFDGEAKVGAVDPNGTMEAFGTSGFGFTGGTAFGDTFAFGGGQLQVSADYVFGTELSGGALITNATLDSIGAQEGVYFGSFGTNQIILTVGVAAVPLSAGGLLLVGALGTLALRRRRRG